MKKVKRPAVNQATPDLDCHKRCRQSPSTTLSELEEDTEFINGYSQVNAPFKPEEALDDITNEFHIKNKKGPHE